MTTLEIIEQRKERGVAVLTAAEGELWRPRIALMDLDLTSGSQCVLGQLYGTYSQGVERLWRTFTETQGLVQDPHNWGIRHGFLAPAITNQASIHRYWVELQRAWVRELQPA